MGTTVRGDGLGGLKDFHDQVLFTSCIAGFRTVYGLCKGKKNISKQPLSLIQRQKIYFHDKKNSVLYVRVRDYLKYILSMLM